MQMECFDRPLCSPPTLRRLLISPDSDSLCSDDLLPSLIADLRCSSADTQLHAARTLRRLAKHSPENRLKIAAAGAIPVLTSLLSAPDWQLQEHATAALFNLSLCNANLDAIAGAGAANALIRPLKSGTPAAKEGAACALLRLAQAHDRRIAIGRSGAIPLLVELLETGELRGKKDAATALYEVCVGARENMERAVEAGVIRVLLDLIADPKSGMVDKAAFVLATVVEVGEAVEALAKEGGIPVVVDVLETGSRRQKEIAAEVLFKMCVRSAAFRWTVAREGALPPLVALSQSGSSQCRRKAEALVELLRQARAGESQSM